ncbi:hypothetical protein [Streptomyces tsukubensis]|uniref:hypothetical protein n=1 Tax=Streptomyces tsukubensis TaxID=83656 RepID=UPI0015C3064D|nr:hypothetical protein [Streptomyces tsukubensis]
MPEPQPAYQPGLPPVDQGSLVRLGLAEPDPIPAPSISPFLSPDLPPYEDYDETA